ncbi:hypothetical protein [Brevundimonas diminuta]|uniref:hypothetical protein n=1 Tax=Brevundimonas diminuta TaxID=293 RepID=UPI003F80A4F6
MSAFLVSNAHVNALATFAADQGLVACAATAARQMWAENAASVRALYSDADAFWPELASLDRIFTYEDITLPSLWHVLKGARCFAYQACEHAGWSASTTKALCDAIQDRAAAMLNLNGPRDPRIDRNAHYEAAPWGLDAQKEAGA